MNLSTLKKEWISRPNAGELQRQIWDGAAENFAQKPIPDFESNPFLNLLSSKNMLTSDTTALDVGCGTGVYSIALASRIKTVAGVDIAPTMIAYGRERVEALNLSNVTFSVLDWEKADIDSLGFRGKFDLVFAHMTPAVSDFSSFDKMHLCSRAYCAMAKPARRQNAVQEAVHALVGIDENNSGHPDDSIIHAFSYLWLRGCSPEITYRTEHWHSVKTVEDAADWYINRSKLQKDLTSGEEQAVRAYLHSISENGMVTETTSTTIITMLWHI
jgi:SAM-dependent methyltransferase